jgi:hypothetical protein
MQDTIISRRGLLRTAAASAGVAALVRATAPAAAAVAPPKKGDKTPALTTEEMAAVDTAMGKKGKYVESEATYTMPLPRADLKVSVKGLPVPTGLGFGGWVSVKRTLDGKGAVLMGDTVLLQEEVNPLIDAVHASGLEVGAIHNHFFYEEPRIFYMHVHGMGSDPADLIKRYAAAVKGTKLFPANQPPAGTPPAKTAKEIFDLPTIDKIVGATGAVNGTTYKYTLGRPDLVVTAMGAEITAAIGLNTWMALAGTPEEAHAAGDVAMLGHEVNPVIAALRKNGIEVVAVHHHMIGDDPHIVFLHYYGHGPAEKLVTTFRAALDELGKKPMAATHSAHG